MGEGGWARPCSYRWPGTSSPRGSRPRFSMIRKERGSMADVIAARAGAFEGLAQPGPVLATFAPSSRFAFRGRSMAIDKAGVALDLPLPREPRRATAKGEHAALRLGPDEWL